MHSFAFVLFGLMLSVPVTAEPLPLIPAPVQLQQQPGVFVFPARLATSVPADAVLLKTQLKLFVQRNQLSSTLSYVSPEQAQLRFDWLEPQPASLSNAATKNRGAYQLQIKPEQIRVLASDEDGFFYALQSLQQLVQRPTRQVTQVPALTITDYPRFAWRGLLLDSARQFLPLPLLKRQLDLMASVKLNVLHLHLTDDQGWRFESKKFPLLQQRGGRDGFYSQTELTELVDYARQRAIRLVPEIDLPGHTTALGLAYPHLMAAPAPTRAETHWGVHKAVLDPSNEQVYQFLEQLLAEVASVFPDSHLHIGGDEVLPDHWLASPSIRAFMQQHQLENAAALQAYFNRRVHQILRKLGKTMIGWDEVIDHPLPTEVTVQSWRGTESLYHAANLGHPAILSTGYYLDQPQSAAYHYRTDPLPATVQLPDPASIRHWSEYSFEFPRKRGSPVTGRLLLLELHSKPMQALLNFDGKPLIQAQLSHLADGQVALTFDSWMGPVRAELALSERLTGQFVVGNAPYQASGQRMTANSSTALPAGFSPSQLSGQAAGKVLGGEIALWSELITPELIDIRLWPNAIAVAERLWSAQSVQDEAFFYQRQSHWLEWAERYNSLQLQQQQQDGFSRLVPAKDLNALALLAQTLEPAHYYHRLHEKSVAGRYYRQPLQQLVDFLPAEQQQLRQFEQQLQRWLQNPRPELQAELLQQLTQWQQAATQLEQIQGLEFAPLVLQIKALSQMAIQWLHQLSGQQPFSAEQLQLAEKQLQQAAQIQQEMVIALHRPIQLLFRQAQRHSG